jgi:cytochrome P450/NADPH-cytochrome P450 reductase
MSGSASGGSVTVFSGCRHRDHDWLYHQELEKMKEEGIISYLYSAFSRDGTKKQYVQDIMKSNSECAKHLVEAIVDGNGRVYICGDGNRMAHDVQHALSEFIGNHIIDPADKNNSSAVLEQGNKYIESMKKNGRFFLDIWS